MSSSMALSPPHGAPLDPQHFLSLLPAFRGTWQIFFVVSGQHSALSWQRVPEAKQFFFLLHFFLHDFASATSVPSTDATPSPATVAAKADLSRPRREASSPI